MLNTLAHKRQNVRCNLLYITFLWHYNKSILRKFNKVLVNLGKKYVLTYLSWGHITNMFMIASTYFQFFFNLFITSSISHPFLKQLKTIVCGLTQGRPSPKANDGFPLFKMSFSF